MGKIIGRFLDFLLYCRSKHVTEEKKKRIMRELSAHEVRVESIETLHSFLNSGVELALDGVKNIKAI